MIRFLASRRFNYIDSFSISVVVWMAGQGMWVAAAGFLGVGTIISVFAERHAGT